MHYEPDTLFFTQLSRFQRLYARSLSARLTPLGLQSGYLGVLHYLWQRDGITQKDLHALIPVEQATLSNTLRRMERDGLIARTANPEDKRCHRITLTQRAASLKPQAMQAIADLRAAVNAGLTVNDRRYFRRIMRQMSESLEDDQQDAPVLLLDEIRP
ncbi:MarR family transcriptional regulator [Pseudodesulfovibrio sp. F-1]|uniref:MarR family transcriptional regulator n=1 Tax=Pseudodesulfovibrio alkaliphilus TaxID=2661613 RepID=A0A7K1KNG2_9BACT|nr:MarR family transcriptional regulator [Pseudodesulfovibrio alkaliphilus]MUM77625.1 MarR family transcriptional regulator [Pseudodesulfovibrio alkaliphilus]